jgi:hypothetical protein
MSFSVAGGTGTCGSRSRDETWSWVPRIWNYKSISLKKNLVFNVNSLVILAYLLFFLFLKSQIKD